MSANEKRPAERRRATKVQAKNTTPEVVYTQPKVFNRRHLLMRLLTILAVVMAVGMGLSIFFRVEMVTVTGTEKYTAWSVSEASGIEQGDSLLFFGKAGAAGRIIRQLPYVKSVRFAIELPATVNIIIEESPLAYSVQDTQGAWWLITSEGRVVEKTDSETAKTATTLIGLLLQDPQVGELAVAAEETASEGELVTTTGQEKMQAALEIMGQLEANEILGQIASINVDNLRLIEVWYKDQYQVKLGTTESMAEKIASMKQAIAQMSQYESGVLDASFTTFPDKVTFRAFSD